MSNPKVNVVGLVFQNKIGERYYSKYYSRHCQKHSNRTYDLETKQGQKKFERGLLDKLNKMNVISKLKPEDNDIFSFGDHTIIIKVINELLIFLICDEEQNYFVMQNLINTIGKILQTATKDQWTGKAIYDNLDTLVLVTDQLIDEGLIVGLDANLAFDRMKMRDPTLQGKKNDVKPVLVTPANVGGAFSSIFGFAKSSLQKTLNLG